MEAKKYLPAPGALPGQILRDPHHPNKLVLNKDSDADGLPDPFFLCGPGDPEGFLYRGNRSADGTRDGDQMELIHKLEENGGNSIYFIAVRTHGGDGWKSKRDQPEIYPDDRHNPWIGQEPANGLNSKILDQWELWFREMDNNGIVIYFFIYDDAIDVAKKFGWPLDPDGNLNPAEKRFVQELVNRFKHHKHLIWCVMEEGQEIGKDWKQHISKIAEAVHEADNYNHVIASHQLSGNVFYHKSDPVISQFAIQTDKDKVATTDSLHQWMLQARAQSNGLYSLVMSEDWVHGNISFPKGDRSEIRQRNWAAAMADAYVMVLGMEIDNTPEPWLNDCRVLQNFFEATTFNQMAPDDRLAFGESSYVLANEGYDYILYSAKADKNLGVKHLLKGTYSLVWRDCANGTRQISKNLKIKEGDQTWQKPRGFGDEVALYIRREDKRPEIRQIQIASSENPGEVQLANSAPVVEDNRLKVAVDTKQDIQLKYLDADGGPGPYSVILITTPKHGALSGVGNDKTFTPEKGYKGKDQFTWKVNDGKADSNVATVKLIIE